MGASVKGFVVTLKKDVGEEYAEKLRQAMLMLDGVLSVEPREAGIDDHMNREQVRHELGQQVLAVLYPDVYGKKSTGV